MLRNQHWHPIPVSPCACHLLSSARVPVPPASPGVTLQQQPRTAFGYFGTSNAPSIIDTLCASAQHLHLLWSCSAFFRDCSLRALHAGVNCSQTINHPSCSSAASSSIGCCPCVKLLDSDHHTAVSTLNSYYSGARHATQVAVCAAGSVSALLPGLSSACGCVAPVCLCVRGTSPRRTSKMSAARQSKA